MIFLNVLRIGKKNGERSAVNDISFTQNKFQKIAIAGETGSGKTTLLKIIAGLIQPDIGEILFEGKKVLGPNEKLIPGHPEIAYLSQHFELRNNYRVEEELESKNILTEKEADTIYTICRIQHLLKRRTDQLSGGERQRVVLARLLTTSPKLLLLDEPYSNLDAIHKNIIKTVINDIGEKLRLTCIMVLHDAPDILSWADMILVMKDGQIIQQDTPEIIYRQPVNEYVAALFGEYNLIDPELLSIPAGNLSAKKILMRPEGFSIATTDNFKISGIVKRILFVGSYYMIDVFTADQVIKVKVNNNQFNEGDTIILSFSGHDMFYV